MNIVQIRLRRKQSGTQNIIRESGDKAQINMYTSIILHEEKKRRSRRRIDTVQTTKNI